MFCASRKHLTAFASSVFERPMIERQEAMSKSKPLTSIEGEVRGLTVAEMKRFQKAKHAPPETLLKRLSVCGPQKTPTKERITIRLSPEVVQRFQDSGDGWQTRVDSLLKDWLKSDKPAGVRFEKALAPC